MIPSVSGMAIEAADLLEAIQNGSWEETFISLSRLSLELRTGRARATLGSDIPTTEDALAAASEIKSRLPEITQILSGDIVHRHVSKFVLFAEAANCIAASIEVGTSALPQTIEEWRQFADQHRIADAKDADALMKKQRCSPEHAKYTIICITSDAFTVKQMHESVELVKAAQRTDIEIRSVSVTSGESAINEIKAATKRQDSRPVVVMSLGILEAGLTEPARRHGFELISRVRSLRQSVAIVVFTAALTLSWEDELRLALEGIEGDRIVLKGQSGVSRLASAIVSCFHREYQLSCSNCGHEWSLNRMQLRLGNREANVLFALARLTRQYGESDGFTSEQIAGELDSIDQENSEDTGARPTNAGKDPLVELRRLLGAEQHWAANLFFYWQEKERECGGDPSIALANFMEFVASSPVYRRRMEIIGGNYLKQGGATITGQKDQLERAFAEAMSSVVSKGVDRVAGEDRYHHRIQDAVCSARDCITSETTSAGCRIEGREIIECESREDIPVGRRRYRLRHGVLTSDPLRTGLGKFDRAHSSVLIVENEEVYLSRIVETVRQIGVRAPIVARTRDEAFELCHLKRPQVVSLDMHLPANAEPSSPESEEFGIEVLQELRKTVPGARVAICTTLFDMASLRAKARALDVPVLYIVPKRGAWSDDLRTVLDVFCREEVEGIDLSATLAEARSSSVGMEENSKVRRVWPLVITVLGLREGTWSLQVNGEEAPIIELDSASRQKLFGTLLAHSGRELQRSGLVMRLFDGNYNALSSAIGDLRRKIVSLCLEIPDCEKVSASKGIVRTDKGRETLKLDATVIDECQVLSPFRSDDLLWQ